MTEFQTVHIIYLIGWLILAASAFASFRLNWQKSVKMGLVWLAIFVGVFLFIQAVQG